jgi:hypothetical protein
MADQGHFTGERPRRPHWLLLAFGSFALLVVWRRLMSTDAEHATAPAATRTRHDKSVNPNIAFEPSDWPVGPVAILYVGLLLLLVISAFVLIAAYPTALPDVARDLRIAPPGPRLQTNAPTDLRGFRADVERRLNTYYWVDQGKGLVHIPIEQAMKQLVATGIPDFPKAPQ